MTLCECGCGQETNIHRGKPNRFINGHSGCTTPWTPAPEAVLCGCGCGEYANPGRRFINGHHAAVRVYPQEKDPLPDGWKSKLSDITTNKECASYLGSIAETVLSRIYNNVQVMPPQNPGFDIICNRDFKIDIKSSATGYKGFWRFSIFKNVIADFFLCIAFESRDDLRNPVHLWMIPGADVNHMSGIGISKSTIDKWSQYEIPLDKLITCCNEMRNGD